MSSVALGIPSDFSSLVARLTLEQKVRLLTGADAWTVYDEPAVGLRPIVMSDGPAGVRGTRIDTANPSTSLPCGVALAATWDEDVIERLAVALGREAHAKGVDVLLAPTVNIVRTPLNGRGFECFSEDPVLTSRIAVAYVRGLQRTGVAATVKHYIGNDSETQRHTYDARIGEHVLRELYLPPFEACIAEADSFLVMAAYNSVNGATMTANARLLLDVLKGELEFSGVVVSDWSATTSTVESAAAGLDLVMPGPRGPWGERLVEAVRSGAVSEAAIDDKVARLLLLAQRIGALNGSAHGEAARVVAVPHSALIDPAFVRDVTAQSFVLLRNEGGLLPLSPATASRIAVIGPNAVWPVTQGGGSVMVLAIKRPGIVESLRDALDAQVTLSAGCANGSRVMPPDDGTVLDPVTGRPGVRIEVRTADGSLIHDAPLAKTDVTWWDGLPQATFAPGSVVTMWTRYRPQAGGRHIIGASAVGKLRIFVDGSPAGESAAERPKETVEALSRPPELRVPVELRESTEVEVRIELTIDGQFAALRLGIMPEADDDDLLDLAVHAARAADVAVVFVGSADSTESEGYDRKTMALPGRQDELVRRVAAANPNTVVVINSGMPVLMPWVDAVPAVIHAWLPGQAFGEALAEVLSGNAEPGGRLPVSIPRHDGDSPVRNTTPDDGALVYDEGLLVGYRGYDRSGEVPLFEFGHGLGYSDWDYEALSIGARAVRGGEDIAVEVRVRNAGTRASREVVQLYVEAPDDDQRRPIRALAAFAAVSAEAGAQTVARLSVPARAFMRFDERARSWVVHAGTYRIRVGRSSRDLRLTEEVVVGR